jgi:hypothetical protein
MSQFDLPKPLGPGRKWGTVHHLVHGVGYFLQDEVDKLVCNLWHLNKNSGLWEVWIFDRPEWMTGGRIVIDLGPHDSPPFERAEVLADAAR